MQNGLSIYEPTGRLAAGAAANIVTRISNAAGIKLKSGWTGRSLRHCFANAIDAVV